MTFKSKPDSNYSVANPTDWIIGNYAELDPTFAGRLAYIAKTKGVKIRLTEGYRSTARQTQLYNLYLQYKKAGKGTIKSAAKPGTSWHEFRLAIDSSTQPIRGMNNTQLAPYGLCKLINSEGWHIQPIETKGQTNRKLFEPIKLNEEEEEEMKRYNKVEELPKGLQKEVQELINSGALKGDVNGNIDVTEDMVRCMIINKRYIDGKK